VEPAHACHVFFIPGVYPMLRAYKQRIRDGGGTGMNALARTVARGKKKNHQQKKQQARH
jgi:hypothetical protein